MPDRRNSGLEEFKYGFTQRPSDPLFQLLLGGGLGPGTVKNPERLKYERLMRELGYTQEGQVGGTGAWIKKGSDGKEIRVTQGTPPPELKGGSVLTGGEPIHFGVREGTSALTSQGTTLKPARELFPLNKPMLKKADELGLVTDGRVWVNPKTGKEVRWNSSKDRWE